MVKRQTIWLSTMMVLSLLVIGFYTVNNEVQGVPATQQQTDKQKKDETDKNKQKDEAAMRQSDYFVSWHLDASQRISQKTEELQKVIASSKSSEEVDKAKKELETLTTNADKTEKAEDLIVAEGYDDAIVEIKEDKVNVTVQAQALDNTKVVKIMNLVAKELGVSARKVIVSTHE